METKFIFCHATTVIGLLFVFGTSAETRITGHELESIVAGADCTHAGLRTQVCHVYPGEAPGSCKKTIQVGDDELAWGEEYNIEIKINTANKCPDLVCLPDTGDKIKPSNPPCTPNSIPAS